ncbi:TPA: 3-deoxy-manno-octulosonate cytidylyltransferase [Candidatus Scatousia excrementigallinarum]|uniref:3-deoxy-manno-octulosonate cytidylyltransferase n=1 Tax=Candidatus Scatousia excrementigallinarum TaxID=2840935 RepID=A0A9D1F1K0_9BACT|nr:3-deoxy-manno-octulosonate cytidylyltransferase [Candidatus Scatousia excrementigallinarum]
MGKTAIIIPARYGSSRLEGKPLIEVNGKPVIQWVYEKAKQAKLADIIIVATDDERIFNAVKAFGGEVEMTSADHKCGSDRIREVVERHPEISYIVNLQGDEPLIKPESIDAVAKNVQEDEKADISTLIRALKDKEEIENPNLVKCVIDNNGFALYFSRSKIPYERNTGVATFYGHLGIYGYKREALLKMTSLPQTPLEKTESLEQLRALENGMKIKTSIVDFVPVGIDTREDLEKFKQIIAKQI